MVPGIPAPKANLLHQAASLARAGRHAEAAGALRRALDAAPRSPEVASALVRMTAAARVQLTSGHPDQAIALLEPLAGSGHAGGEILTLCGYAFTALGRKDDAETAFKRCVEQDPGNRDAALRLAAVLADNGKPAAAERVARAEVARHGRTADTTFVLGRALLGQSRLDAAEAAFREVAQAQPGHQVAQANLMELVWMRTGDVGEAAHVLDEALRKFPGLAWPWIARTRLLMSAGLPHEALAIVEQGLAAAGPDAALLTAAATVALEFDADLALKHATQAVQRARGDRAARAAHGNALLGTGQARAALDVADALHHADPTDGLALAMRADALRMLGDQSYRQLLDYQTLVRAEPIDVPDGWSDRGAYLTELVTDLERLHDRPAHPIGNSLRGGSQVQLMPGQSESAAIRAFPRAIDGPIRRYLQALGKGTDPMRARNTGDYALRGMWSVCLRPNGFHVTHYHPRGWISSAFYLRLPRSIEARHGEGWLKFGEPAFPTRPPLGPEYFVKPQPGLLVLFPSYLWHGTVPFSGDPAESRLTIAFDAVPAGSG